MAGFMAGFADGFNKQFTLANERKKDREDDAFKLRYLDAIKNRDERAAEQKQDKKDIEYAKAMARAYGQPSGAWQEIYQMKRSGADESTIVKTLSENTFTGADLSVSNNDAQAPGGDLSQAAGSAVDAQMKSSGMATPADGGIFSTTSTGQDPLARPDAPGMSQSSQNDVNNRVGEAVGMPGDQVGLDTGTADPSRFPEAPPAPQGAEPLSPTPGTPDPAAPTAEAPEASEAGPAPKSSTSSNGPWTPKVDSSSYFKANSVPEAMVGVKKAEMTGDPAIIKMAKDVLDANIAAESLKARTKAEAEGLYFKPRIAAVQLGPDQWSYLTPAGEGMWTDPKNPGKVYRDGDVTVFDKTMTEEMSNQVKAIREPAQKYQQAVIGFVSNVRNADMMMNTLNENPGVAGWAGSLSKVADEMVQNVGGVVNLVSEDVRQDGIMSSTSQKQLDDAIVALQDRLKSYVGTSVVEDASKMAIARRLYEAQAVKMAYAHAAAVGQTGQGVAAKEFDRFYRSLMNANETALKQGLTNYVVQNYDVLKQEGAALTQFNPDLELFKSVYGVPSPVQVAPDLDELIAVSPDTKMAFDRMRGLSQTLDPNVSNPDQINTKVPVPKGVTGEDAELWPHLSEPARQQILRDIQGGKL